MPNPPVGRIRELLDQHYAVRRPVLPATVTSVNTASSQAVCTIGGQAGVSVRLPPNSVVYPGTGLLVEQRGSGAAAMYVALTDDTGLRADSGLAYYPADEGSYGAGDLIIGNANEVNQWHQYSTGNTYYRYGTTINGVDYANGNRDFGPPDGLHWHYDATTAKLSVYSNTVELTTFDGETRSIQGWERWGTPLGPSLEVGPVVDGSGVTRYMLRLLRENGVVAVGILTGTEANPNDVAVWLGAEGDTNRLTYLAGLLDYTGTIQATSGTIGGWTLGATVLTAGSSTNTVGLDSGGTNPAFYAGNTTPTSAPFRVTNAGVLTATNATVTGTINWGNGRGTLNASGLFYTESASNYFQVKPETTPTYRHLLEVQVASACAALHPVAIYGESDTGWGIAGYANNVGIGVFGKAENNGVGVQGTNSASSASGIGVAGNSVNNYGIQGYSTNSVGISAWGGSTSYALEIRNAPVDGGSQRYTLMGTAASGMDGLNRDTADARYTRWAGELASSPAGISGMQYYDTATSKARLYANAQWLDLN